MSFQTRSVDNTVSSMWVNPDNAFTENDQCTTATTDGDQNVYNVINTPFTLPGGVTIDGIEVKVVRSTDDNDYYEIELQDKTPAWLLKTGTSYFAVCADAAQETLGGSVDDWTGSWDAAHINSSSFQIRLTYQKLQKANIPSVDHIEVTVYYTLGAIDHEKEVNEALTLADVRQTVSAYNRPYAESLTVDDIIFSSANYIRNFIDSLDITSYISPLAIKVIGLIQAISTNDYIASATNYARAIPTQALTVADILANSADYARSFISPLTIDDFITRQSQKFLSIINSLNIVDIVATSTQYSRSLIQSVTIDEVFSRISSHYRVFIQSATVNDLIQSSKSVVLSIIESLTLTDIASSITGYYRWITQAMTVTDTANVSIPSEEEPVGGVRKTIRIKFIL